LEKEKDGDPVLFCCRLIAPRFIVVPAAHSPATGYRRDWRGTG
jgi:hypothetical protein